MGSFKVELDELATMHAAILGLSYALNDEPLKADLTASATGSGAVVDSYGDFVHAWSDARWKISTNLDQLGGAVLAALEAYRSADRAIQEAAVTPSSSAGPPNRRFA